MGGALEKRFAGALRECAKIKSLTATATTHQDVIRAFGRHLPTLLGNLVIAAYARCGAIEHARTAFERQSARDVRSWNAIIEASGRAGDAAAACAAFDRMPSRSSASWSAIVAAMARAGQPRDALWWLKRMDLEGEGEGAEIAALLAAVAACASLKSLQDGVAIHREIVSSGLERESPLATALVDMYGRCRCAEQAQSVFDRIREPSVVLQAVLFVAYARSGHLLQATHCFAAMPQRNIVCWTSMISLVSRAHNLELCWEIFEKMSARSVVSWNAMLAALSHGGDPAGSLQLLRTMDLEGVELDLVSFVCAIDACASLGAISLGQILHDELMGREIAVEGAVGNAVVGMYARWGNVDAAREVLAAMDPARRDARSSNTFLAALSQRGSGIAGRRWFQRMPARDLVSWNLLIAAQTHGGAPGEGVQILERMPQWNPVTWNTIVSGFLEIDQPEHAIQIFRRMDLEGVDADCVGLIAALYACAGTRDRVTGAELELELKLSPRRLDHDDRAEVAALIHMYGRCGMPRRCTEIFDNTARRDALCWTALVRSFAVNGHLERARVVLEAMPRGEVYAWNAILGAYAAVSRIDCAAETFLSMPWRSVVSWNVMIAGYAHNKKHDAALLLFRAMDLDGVSSSPVSFISAMDSCGALVAVAQGKILHAEATAKRFESDVGVATSIVSMYGKFGLLDDAFEAFYRATHRNVVSWNALAAAFAENGQSRDAIAVFWTMLLEAEAPSGVSFLIAIAACSHAGLYADGLQHSIAMSNDHALHPGLDHYLCVIDLLGRAGQLRDAEELANAMPYDPDAVAWTAVLGACCNHCDVHRAARAAERVLELGHDPAAYSLLLNACFSDIGPQRLDTQLNRKIFVKWSREERLNRPDREKVSG